MRRTLCSELIVKGTEFRVTPKLFKAIHAGDQLTLTHESTNAHDPHAVRVVHELGHIGYIPKTHSQIFATLQSDMGLDIYAVVVESSGPLERITMKVMVRK